MSPRALKSEVAAYQTDSRLLVAMFTGIETARSLPANDVDTRGQMNLLVRRRRRQTRISAR